MAKISLSMVSRERALKLVVSQGPLVIFVQSIAMPENPDAKDYAVAMRLMAQQIEDNVQFRLNGNA